METPYQVKRLEKNQASTVCDLVGLTLLLVGISAMIVVVISGWLQQQIPQLSQHQRLST